MQPSDTAGIDRRWNSGARAVLECRAYFRTHFGRVESEWKHDGTRVTASDLEITRKIQSRLAAEFRGDDFFSEENDPGTGPLPLRSRFAWVLDPVDGTNNYALAIPSCAISLALLEDGRPVGGWIYDYARDRLISGGPGRGAWDGDRAVTVAAGRPGPQSVIGMNAPYEHARIAEVYPVMKGHKIRCLGSSTLHVTYAAIGLFHGAFDHNVKVWDIAAAAAIMAGAGGELRTLDRPVFPLREFSVSMDRIRFVGGSRETCDVLEGYLRAATA